MLKYTTATSWNGYGATLGTCTVHSWNDGIDEDEGEPSVGNRVDSELNRSSIFYGGTDDSRPRPRRSRRVAADDEDDER